MGSNAADLRYGVVIDGAIEIFALVAYSMSKLS
jgi:hypothetical protein